MARTVKGIALAPGVSKNNRLYTASHIESAYKQMSKRISDPDGLPIVMRASHGSGDNSLQIAAQIKSVSLVDGKLAYEANFLDTDAGRTMAELAKPDPDTGKSAVKVSISGFWVGEPKTVEHDGREVETADGIEINAVDFTANPGVSAASATAETAMAGAISETATMESFVDEISPAEAMRRVHEAAQAAKKEPYGDVKYADPGYQADKKKRYPIDTAAHVRAAWSYINQKDNAAQYTSAQVDSIKSRIKAAAKKVGVKIEDAWLIDVHPLAEAQIAEMYGEDVAAAGSFSINATNGPISVSICSYSLNPADLELVGAAAMKAVTDALKAIDPDMDGDIDVPGVSDDADTDGDSESVAPDLSGDDQMETTPQAAEVAVSETRKDLDMADANETNTDEAPEVSETAAPVAAFDYKAMAEAFAAMLDARDAAKAAAEAPAAEASPEATAPVTEADTATPDAGQLREAAKEAVLELVAEGALKPERKGFVPDATEESSNIDAASLWENRGRLFLASAREHAGR